MSKVESLLCMYVFFPESFFDLFRLLSILRTSHFTFLINIPIFRVPGFNYLLHFFNV